MQENNKKPAGHSKTISIVVISVLILALVIGGVVAALSLSTTTVPGKGSITVPTSPAPVTTTTSTATTTTVSGTPAAPAYTLSSDVNGADLLTSASNVDFSCRATDYTGAFSQAVTVYIENTGTNGTGSDSGALATISSLPVTFNYTSSEGSNLALVVAYGTPEVIGSETVGSSSTFNALPTGEAEAITLTLTGTVTPNPSDVTELLETLPTFSFTFSPS